MILSTGFLSLEQIVLVSLLVLVFAVMIDMLQYSPAAEHAQRFTATPHRPSKAGAEKDLTVKLTKKVFQDKAENGTGNSADGPLASESFLSQRCY